MTASPISELRASYEAVAYDGRAIRLSEPDAVAAIAVLHGLTPPSPEKCRVLELGCASGANLLSMALRFPKSTFVGVDFAPTQVESGKFAVGEMGLRNIDLQCRSIVEIDDAEGMFDYIICHGVYSWVPPDVQDAILRVCDRNLAPNGIAYVSYNTYPGWHRREMLRDMLTYHDDLSLDPSERVERARAFVSALASVHSTTATTHGASIREETDLLQRQTDRHLFHEQLEPWNEPVYFSEFMRRAATHRLSFLAEANPVVEPAAMVQLPDTLAAAGDRIRTEQYKDFVHGRTFRRTLLCHDESIPTDEPVADAVRQLRVRSRVEIVAPSDEDAARGPGVAAFRIPEGRTVTTNNPVMTSTLMALEAAAPVTVTFDDLKRGIAERLTSSGASVPDDAALTEALLLCARAGFVEFRVMPSKMVSTPGVRPKASALARWQALYIEEVTTLGHWPYTLSGAERFLITQLDGAKDRTQLARLTEHAFASGALKLDGYVPTREGALDIVDQLLAKLARSALLVA